MIVTARPHPMPGTGSSLEGEALVGAPPSVHRQLGQGPQLEAPARACDYTNQNPRLEPYQP